jgi:AAA+ superfamily predicted ATPase
MSSSKVSEYVANLNIEIPPQYCVPPGEFKIDDECQNLIDSGFATKEDFIIKPVTYGIVGQDEAKNAIEKNLYIRAYEDEPQKLIMLEGSSGTGKSTLIMNICAEFVKKYPTRFVYKKIRSSDLTQHVDTSKKIDLFFNEIQNKKFKSKVFFNSTEKNKLHKIIFIDEVEDLCMSRAKSQHIRYDRTTAMIDNLNREIPNTIFFFATNRPKELDSAILSRCEERINCYLPSNFELRQIIDLHIKDEILSQEKKDILHKYLVNSVYKFWNGRDILQLSHKLTSDLKYKRISKMKEIVTGEDVSKFFTQMENSKKQQKNDYIDDPV